MGILVSLPDVLTITTGLMLSDRGVVGLRGLMAFLTGLSHDLNDTSITDTGCIELAQTCAEGLIRQHAWLADINPEGVAVSKIDEWLQTVVEERGTHIDVEPLVL